MECVKTQQRINRSQWLIIQPIHKVLLYLTRPMLPAIFAVLGLDLFDTYLVSKLGTESLAALSLTIPVTSSLFALAIGLSIGTASVLSYSLGKGDHHEAKRLTGDSLMIHSIIAAVIGVIGFLTIEPLFSLLGANYALIPESFHLGPRPDIMPLITDYMQLRYIGFVFMLIAIISNAVMRATGDMAFAGRLMFGWAIFTAAIDYLLMTSQQEPNLVNIGQGHLAADSLFALVSMVLLAKRENLLGFQSPTQAEFITNCRRILNIGLPATCMSLLTPIALGIVTSWVAFYGREAIAAFGVISRVETLALFLPMALSTSLPIFVGQNFGAGCLDRSLSAIEKCLGLTLVVQLLVYLLLILVAFPLAQLFSASQPVISMIVNILWFLPLSYAGQGIVFLVVSSLNAIHRPKSALLLSGLRMFALFVPAAYIGAYLAGFDGLFIGLMVANLLAGLLAYVWIKHVLKPHAPLISSSPNKQQKHTWTPSCESARVCSRTVSHSV